MSKVKKIKVFSFIKFHGVIGAIVGLIAGIIYSFGGLIIDSLVTTGWITSNETPGLSYGTLLAFGALIGMPIIFLVFGIVVGVIEVLIYNIFARWLIGIDINFERKITK